MHSAGGGLAVGEVAPFFGEGVPVGVYFFLVFGVNVGHACECSGGMATFTEHVFDTTCSSEPRKGLESFHEGCGLPGTDYSIPQDVLKHC